MESKDSEDHRLRQTPPSPRRLRKVPMLLFIVILFASSIWLPLHIPLAHASGPTVDNASVNTQTTSITLPAGSQLYIYGFATGGCCPTGDFQSGQYAAVNDLDGFRIAALAVTTSNTNSYPSQTAYNTIGGIGVSGYSSYTSSYQTTSGSGPELLTSNSFSISVSNSLAIVFAVGGGSQCQQLSGIQGLQIDANTANSNPIITIGHAYLASGSYTATMDATQCAAGQDPNHAGNVLGIFIFLPGSSGTPPSISLLSPFYYGNCVSINGAEFASTPGASLVSTLWNWGDGFTTSSSFPATHTYTGAGTYLVQVSATDSNGLTGSSSISADVTGSTALVPPQLSLFTPTVSGQSVLVNGVSNSNACGPTQPLPLFAFDWGDGIIDQGSFPHAHTYTNSGNYSVCATATDSFGVSTTQCALVTVGTPQLGFSLGSFQSQSVTGTGWTTTNTNLCPNNSCSLGGVTVSPVSSNPLKFSDGSPFQGSVNTFSYSFQSCLNTLHSLSTITTSTPVGCVDVSITPSLSPGVVPTLEGAAEVSLIVAEPISGAVGAIGCRAYEFAAEVLSSAPGSPPGSPFTSSTIIMPDTVVTGPPIGSSVGFPIAPNPGTVLCAAGFFFLGVGLLALLGTPIALLVSVPATLTTALQNSSITLTTAPTLSTEDSATLSGGNSPTGSIEFNAYFNDNTCVSSPVFTSIVSVNGDGNYSSTSFTPMHAGTYYWTATYIADANNTGVGPTTCAASGEVLTVTPSSPNLMTTLSSTSPLVGTAVTDSAALSGGFNAGGTVTYTLFGNDGCTGTGSLVSTVTVSDGVVPDSGSVILAVSGTYGFQASYSGDVNNNPATSACEQFNASDFTLVASSPIAVDVGQSANSTTTITALDGFGNIVTFDDVASPGLTCGPITPIAVTGSGEVTVSCSAPTEGNYTVTMTGTTGSLSHTAIIVFQVRDFQIFASPTNVSTTAGIAVKSAITVIPLNGFVSDVALTIVVSPSTGLTCSISSASITGGSGTITLTCSGTGGTYVVTVAGASGSLSDSATVTINVNDFTVTASSASISMVQGSSGTSSITVTSVGGFTGTVVFTFRVSSGLTANFNPATISMSGSSALTIGSIFPTTAAGTYSVNVTGTSGSLSHSVTIRVIVTSAASGVLPPVLSQSTWNHRFSLSKYNNVQAWRFGVQNNSTSTIYFSVTINGIDGSGVQGFTQTSQVYAESAGKNMANLSLSQTFSRSQIGETFNFQIIIHWGTTATTDPSKLPLTSVATNGAPTSGSFTILT